MLKKGGLAGSIEALCSISEPPYFPVKKKKPIQTNYNDDLKPMVMKKFYLQKLNHIIHTY